MKLFGYKLTNTWKHLAVFGIVGIPAFLLMRIPGAKRLEVLGFVAVFLITCQIERMQHGRRNKSKPWNWIDSVVDIIAGNVGFHTVYWILTWTNK